MSGGGPVLGTEEARRAAVVRVATTLRTDIDDPVTMPFTTPAPPKPLKLVRTLVSTDSSGGYEGQLVFSDRPDEMNPVSRIPQLLVISARTDSRRTGYPKNGNPSDIVDGHPAIIDFSADSGR